MKSAVAIRHVPFEDLGVFEPVLQARGYCLRYYDIGADEADPLESLDPDLLIVLGGPIGADDDATYPFLNDELALIERRLAANRPTLGICLGAQLIARAAGARITPAAQKEIGFKDVVLTDAGRRSCLAPFADDGMTLHWHGDTFDLPSGAERLASTDVCENQAFSIGANIIGFQFHPEAACASIEKWLIGHTCELTAAGIDIPALRADAARLGPRVERKGEAVITGWLDGLEA